MPRPRGIPAYKLHKSSGQARVIVDGRHVYLGPFGSPESHQEYARLISQFLENKPSSQIALVPMVALRATRTVNDVILSYWEYAKSYYVHAGEPTTELVGLKYAMRPLRNLYGGERAGDFGPKNLALVRDHMVREVKLARTEVNKRIGRIKRMFKWAVAEELVDPAVYHGLQALAGLKYGRTDARETEPVRPANDKDVDAILPYLSPQVSAMVRLQRLTGAFLTDIK